MEAQNQNSGGKKQPNQANFPTTLRNSQAHGQHFGQRVEIKEMGFFGGAKSQSPKLNLKKNKAPLKGSMGDSRTWKFPSELLGFHPEINFGGVKVFREALVWLPKAGGFEKGAEFSQGYGHPKLPVGHPKPGGLCMYVYIYIFMYIVTTYSGLAIVHLQSLT